MVKFLKTAYGEVIRADLINRVYIDNFKVYGAVDTNERGVVLLDARSTVECESYIDRLTEILSIPDVSDNVIFSARADIYEYVLYTSLKAKTDKDCEFDTFKLNKYFSDKYRSDLIQNAVNDLYDRGYIENIGYSSNVGHNFSVMAWPSFKAVQWMMNNLFFYYSPGYERKYGEIFTKMSSTKEVGHRWPRYADHHTKMVIQAMKDTGFLADGEVQEGSLKIIKEPEGEWDEDGSFREYKVALIRDATLMMEAQDYVKVDDEGEPLFDTVKESDFL